MSGGFACAVLWARSQILLPAVPHEPLTSPPRRAYCSQLPGHQYSRQEPRVCPASRGEKGGAELGAAAGTGTPFTHCRMGTQFGDNGVLRDGAASQGRRPAAWGVHRQLLPSCLRPPLTNSSLVLTRVRGVPRTARGLGPCWVTSETGLNFIQTEAEHQSAYFVGPQAHRDLQL